jgi:xanthine dehydrogenase accessory factor
LVASRKKGTHLLEYVRASGIDQERLARVKFPAGLDLGGMNAAEIAVSIAAEIVQRRHAARGAKPAAVAVAAPPAPTPSRRAVAVAPFPIDPVCGMPVDPATATHTLTVGETTLYFCCPHCKARYERQQREAAGTEA